MSTRAVRVASLEQFRVCARALLAAAIAPGDVFWLPRDTDALPGLDQPPVPAAPVEIRVPRAFADLLEPVSCHRDEARWSLLYEALWRLNHGESQLMDVATDPLTHRLATMNRQIRLDLHHVHAFVRFRRVDTNGESRFVAWHRPDHAIVRLAAPFFRERFGAMTWSILTPDESMHWDGFQLQFSPGLPRSSAPSPDALEDVWIEYYRAVFNPARVAIRTMKRGLPTRHWSTLPESAAIGELLREAPARVAHMVAAVGVEHAAASLVPAARSLPVIDAAVRACAACELHETATQTVCGEGPAAARLMLVGEQPGDEEDRTGRPFVGPAGALLDRALEAAGIVRGETYVTNAVKHFRHRAEGKRRIHQTPRARDVAACRPWLDAEIETVGPAVIVCLGNTAARALLGPNHRGERDRGRVYERSEAPAIVPTFHPAALLRHPDERVRSEMWGRFVGDLTMAAAMARVLVP